MEKMCGSVGAAAPFRGAYLLEEAKDCATHPMPGCGHKGFSLRRRHPVLPADIVPLSWRTVRARPCSCFHSLCATAWCTRRTDWIRGCSAVERSMSLEHACRRCPFCVSVAQLDGVELTAAAACARQDALKLACIDLAEALDVEIAEAFYSLSKGRAYYEMTNEQIARVRIREKEVVVGLCSERCAGQIIKHGACHSRPATRQDCATAPAGCKGLCCCVDSLFLVPKPRRLTTLSLCWMHAGTSLVPQTPQSQPADTASPKPSDGSRGGGGGEGEEGRPSTVSSVLTGLAHRSREQGSASAVPGGGPRDLEEAMARAQRTWDTM